MVYVNGFCDVGSFHKINFQEIYQSDLSSEGEAHKFVIDLDPILINIPGDKQNQIVEALVQLETLEVKEITSKQSQITDIATLILTSQEHQLLMEKSFRNEVASEIRSTINSILTKDSILKINLDCSYNI